MKWLLLIIPILAIVLFAYYKTPSVAVEPGYTTQQVPEFMPFTARFEIKTLGTTRVFTDSKYHNRSEDVFISADDPGLIHVLKDGVTWQQFFDTMPAPMKVTPDCLYTGTGQTFCSNKSLTLEFILNGQYRQDALSQIIAKNDILQISFE